MELRRLICVLSVLASFHTASGHNDVTVCPDDYSPRDGCVTLDQLLSDNLIQSNTTFKFVSATFKMKQDVVIKFENVSNITLESAGPGPHKANITCVGENSGFIFYNVSGLAIQNLQVIGCGANWILQNSVHVYYNCTFGLTESSDIMIQNVAFKQGKGCGVYGFDIYGYFIVMNSLFVYMQGSALSLTYPSSELNDERNISITISHSRFDDLQCHGFYGLIHGCVISIYSLQQNLAAIVHIADVSVTNNTHASDISGIFIWFESSLPNKVTFERCNYTNNHVVGEIYSNTLSGSELLYVYNGDTEDNTVIEITESFFVNNDFKSENQTIDQFSTKDNFCGILLFYVTDCRLPVTVSMRNVAISDNAGWYSAAILFETDEIQYTHCELVLEMVDLNLINNNIYSSAYYKKGTVNVKSVNNVKVEGCSFVNNSATGLLIEDSIVHFSGFNVIQGNKGYNGGGMALYWGCQLFLAENVTILMENNVAENIGGGLYVQQGRENIDVDCFINPEHVNTVSLEFNNNSAVTAGNDWYGGYLYMCNVTTSDGDRYGWQVVTDLVHSPDNYTVDVTSDPLHVCDCSTQSVQDCINAVRTLQTVQTYPGKLFNLSLIAVGQLLNTTTMSGVPTAIYAGLLLHPTAGTIPQTMQVQTGERICSERSYRVNSMNHYEIMVLTTDDNINKIPKYFMMLWEQEQSQWPEYVKKLFSHDLTVPTYVEIQLLRCPVGFDNINGECSCSTSLMDFVINCSIDTSLIVKKNSFIWLSVLNSSEQNVLYLTHKHCPFHYCISSNFGFSLEEPDTQCDHNRSGVLCGECKSGYSLTLGRMECRQCTNIYLLLLVPFGLAGILLILFLSLTDMTVTAGTINGLLFFANVVRENQATFFPPQAAGGFLSVFIAWLNLDFGINTCFFNGLDSYIFTWLQLLFPVYIWLLTFSIIIASRHVKFMNKVCGHNILHVLATLFLLSYTKLQRTIATALSFTVVDVSDGNKYFVWLEDGSVHYLQGKHIPLFLVNVLILIIIFIPYTLSITLGPWLQTKTQYRVFSWVQGLKPFFDAYFGPLKDKHRYWTGLLLLFRMILSLISAVNILGDDSINLLVISTLTSILVVLVWQSGGVYKIWILSALDSFFLVNLGVLASAILYNRVSRGSQYAAIYFSTGSAFAIFCAILLYHCFEMLKLFNAVIRNRNKPRPLLEEDNFTGKEDSDDDLFNAIDEGHKSDYGTSSINSKARKS